jgi:hypothetical protein
MSVTTDDDSIHFDVVVFDALCVLVVAASICYDTKSKWPSLLQHLNLRATPTLSRERERRR